MLVKSFDDCVEAANETRLSSSTAYVLDDRVQDILGKLHNDGLSYKVLDDLSATEQSRGSVAQFTKALGYGNTHPLFAKLVSKTNPNRS